MKRLLLGGGVAVAAIGFAIFALGSGDWPGEGNPGGAIPDLGEATEADVPAAFKAATIPTDAAAVAAGKQIAEKRCIVCHAADLKGKQIGDTRSADLTRSARERSEAFLLWAITEGSSEGMPSWKALPEEQRLAVVAYLKSLK